MCRMMPGRNMNCRTQPTPMLSHHRPRRLIVALCAILTGLFMLCVTTPAQAQETDAAELDPASLIDAFLTARSWVDEMALPAPEDQDARVRIPGVAGVCAVVRNRGRILGIGTSPLGFRGDGDPTYEGLDLRNAVSRALSEALIDPVVIGLSDDMRADLGTKLSLEIEFAAMPQPLIGRTFDSLERRLESGFHGVAMRQERTWAVRFPLQIAVRNRGGQLIRELESLSGEFDLPLRSYDELSNTHGIAAYRFTAVSFFQSSPDAAPVELTQGQRLVDSSDVSAATIPALTEQWIEHLLKRLWPDEQGMSLGIRGDYNPLFDIYDPIVAVPGDQALAAYALLDASTLSALDPEVAQRARAGGLRILEALAVVSDDPVEPDPAESELASAFLTIAAAHIPDGYSPSPELVELIGRAREQIYLSWNDANGFMFSTEEALGPNDPKPGFGEAKTKLVRKRMSAPQAAIMCLAATYLAGDDDPLFTADWSCGLEDCRSGCLMQLTMECR